jgi:hypothetical protein
MSAALQLWSILYKRLIPHLVSICLILLLAIYSLLGVYALEQRVASKLKERLANLPIFVLYSSEGMEKGFIDSIKDNPLVGSLINISSQEILQNIEQEFDLPELSQWVKQENLSAYLVIYLDDKNFSPDRFQDFHAYLTNQPHITDVYYNANELERWGDMASLFKASKFVPMIFILVIAGILVFLMRRLMRVRQIRCWEIWKRKGIPKLYKFSHLFIEMGVVIIVLAVGVGIPCFIWQDALLPLISSMHYGWYGVFALLVLYFIISFLNLIGYEKKS